MYQTNKFLSTLNHYNNYYNDLDSINQSLESNILCGTCYESNNILFNCQDWDDGLYIIYNTHGAGNVCEFLCKNDSLVTMTNIAPQTHTIDGYNITFQTGTWYVSLWAHKIIKNYHKKQIYHKYTYHYYMVQ